MQYLKRIFLYLMAVFYVFAGAAHFLMPGYYTAIMPPWLPRHLELVYISGACEILLALLLLPSSTRRTAAWGLIALLIAVFPANIQMTINFANEHNPGLWYTIIRLPVQILLIWWAWVYTNKKIGCVRSIS
jgi:uncharacterized membrane protein